jgi:hypothetical protein
LSVNYGPKLIFEKSISGDQSCAPHHHEAERAEEVEPEAGQLGGGAGIDLRNSFLAKNLSGNFSSSYFGQLFSP